MRDDLRSAARLLLVCTLLLGAGYPLLVGGLALCLDVRQPDRRTVLSRGAVVGLEAVGQEFRGAGWFWSRPSAVGTLAATSGGSNLGVANPALHDSLAARTRALRRLDPGNPAPIPSDLVCASGSGLDPHISLAGARWQAGRVAKARGLDPARVDSLLEALAEPEAWGSGPPRVNVLRLNAAIHDLLPRTSPKP